jgi:hypothetical protein
MKVKVLLSSGDEDSWDGAAAIVSMELGGALLVGPEKAKAEELWAIYAPGMWMRMELEDDQP